MKTGQPFLSVRPAAACRLSGITLIIRAFLSDIRPPGGAGTPRAKEPAAAQKHDFLNPAACRIPHASLFFLWLFLFESAVVIMLRILFKRDDPLAAESHPGLSGRFSAAMN